MSNSLKSIQQLIKNGQRKQAIQQLKAIIDTDPSADAWYLMAVALNEDKNKIKALKRALKLDALHTPANRLLLKLEGEFKPTSEPVQPVPITPEQEDLRQEKYERQKEQKRSRRRRRGFGCLFSLLTGTIFCVVILSIAGMIPGIIGVVLRLTSGVDPVTQIDNVPIDQYAESIYQLEPVFSRALNGQDFAFIDHGYVNEHVIDAVNGDVYVMFVQFLSLVVTDVPQNVVLIDPEGNSDMSQCTPQTITEDYDNGVAWVCRMYTSGQWRLRIIGIEGETVGAYVTGIQPVEPQ